MGANIMPLVGGEWVGAAVNSLPHPSTAPSKIMETVIEVPRLGPVRFTMERTAFRHNKHVGHFWRCKHAEAIGSGSAEAGPA